MILLSARETRFECEPRWVQVRHWYSQLFEFLRRAVPFYTNKIGYLEHLRQWCGDVLQMSEKTLSASIRLTTKNFVAVYSEAVEKVVFLGCGSLDELSKR